MGVKLFERIEVVNWLDLRDEVPVPNISDSRYAVDARGRKWVHKFVLSESDIIVECAKLEART